MTDSYSTHRDPDSGESVSESLLESLSTHAVFMLGAEGEITHWPAPAETLYGYAPDGVLGQHVTTLFADGKEELEVGDQPERVLEDAREGLVEVDHWHERADGSVFWGTLSLSPLSGDRRGFAAVSRDTTERKEYERMLERRNDRLKEFTDILAHDLRNPLQVIDSRLSLYEKSGDRDHLDSIHETTDRMERLVEDLLRVARQGVVVEEPEPTDIEPIVRMAWQGMGSESDSSLQCDSVPAVSADADRLCEVFENVFRNAVEHGGEGVTVRVGPLHDGFYVEDDGPGIPADRREEVFDHGVTTIEDGSGYGLSVVRTVVNAHGWDIAATEGESGGTRLEITGVDFLE